MKQSDIATAASPGCRKREAEITRNVSTNMEIRHSSVFTARKSPNIKIFKNISKDTSFSLENPQNQKRKTTG